MADIVGGNEDSTSQSQCHDIHSTIHSTNISDQHSCGGSRTDCDGDASWRPSTYSEAGSESDDDFDESWKPSDDSDGKESLDDDIDNSDIDLYEPGFGTSADEVLRATASTLRAGDEVEYVKRTESLDSDTFIKKAIISSIQPLSNGGHRVTLDNKGLLFTGGGHTIRRIRAKCAISGSLVDTPMPLWLELSEFTIIEDDVGDGPVESSRLRYSNGLTREQATNEQKQQRRDENAAHEHPRHIFAWAKTDNEYNVSASILNKLYRDLAEIGQFKKFNNIDLGIMTVLEKKEFDKKVKSLRKFLCREKKSNPNPIKLPKRDRIPDRVPLAGERVLSPHEFQQIESTLQFEHEMLCYQIRTCEHCGINKDATVKSEDELSKPYKCGAGTTCYRMNKAIPNFYLARNLQPVWYEREDNDDFRLDANGLKIVRYDIPMELQDLTISEGLLIRRFAPYIPSIHVRNGTIALKGHCCSFAQHIDTLCDELPQRKETVLTFVRYLGSNLSKHKYVKNLRVNRQRVLTALRWLKRHHTGYHDIVIREENLDWMNEPEEDNIATESELQEIERVAYEEQRDEYVSGAHEDLDEGELECTAAQTNERRLLPTTEQAQPIEELIDIAESSGQGAKVQNFPPIDLDPVS